VAGISIPCAPGDVATAALMPHGLRQLRLGLGDIAKWRAQAITVSTNLTLTPNENPHYWRFAARSGTNGAVHEMAGPQLLAACRALRPSNDSVSGGAGTAAAHTRGDQFLPWMPGDKLVGNEPWKTSQQQQESWQEDGGASEAALSSDAVRRCEVGCVVVTPAFGRLVTELGVEHVLHVVVPDGISGGPPNEPLLRQSFTAVLEAATLCGASSLALPALGCGVQGWRAATAARAAALAVQSATAAADGDQQANAVDRLDMVMGSASMWRTWR
jgi:O-acetyl-ADP-ribose deacetylase (regulator of RNase III)